MDSTLPILAVDLGKFNSVLCWFATSSGELRLYTVRTSPDSPRSPRESESVLGAVAGRSLRPFRADTAAIDRHKPLGLRERSAPDRTR